LGVTPLMHSWLSQLATLVSETQEGLAFAAVLLPIALASFPSDRSLASEAAHPVWSVDGLQRWIDFSASKQFCSKECL
jgi:hypothetical protein